MAEFMLLVRSSDEGTRDYSPEQSQRLMQRYFDWSDKLQSEGRHRGSNELQAGGRVVRVRDGQIVVDGPYAETKEGVGGYFMIEAGDEDEAAAIARDCPVLDHGGLVEVREIKGNR